MDKLIITDNPQQTTGIELFQIYVAMTKEQLLMIAKKLDLWVSLHIPGEARSRFPVISVHCRG